MEDVDTLSERPTSPGDIAIVPALRPAPVHTAVDETGHGHDG
jgi:hypothetical protein